MPIPPRWSVRRRGEVANGPRPIIATVFPLLGLVLGLGLGPAPTAAHAASILTLQIQNSNAPIGGIGSFDVTVTSTGGTSAVSAFMVQLSVAAGSGITFTGATPATTAAPYLFGMLQSPPFTNNITFPNTTFTANDLDLAPPFVANLASGQTAGLEHVTYSVAAGTPSGPVTVSMVGNLTALFDINGSPMATSLNPGTITVSPSAVPEPSSLVMGGIAAASLLVVYCSRKSSSVS
jgi:hypothetical protein